MHVVTMPSTFMTHEWDQICPFWHSLIFQNVTIFDAISELPLKSKSRCTSYQFIFLPRKILPHCLTYKSCKIMKLGKRNVIRNQDSDTLNNSTSKVWPSANNFHAYKGKFKTIGEKLGTSFRPIYYGWVKSCFNYAYLSQCWQNKLAKVVQTTPTF